MECITGDKDLDFFLLSKDLRWEKERVPYSQRYLFNANPDNNHNANPTYSNGNSKWQL